MHNLTLMKLQQASMGAPVHAKALSSAADLGQPGVVAVVAQGASGGWAVLADHPHNEGPSATNSAERYARAAAQSLGLAPESLTWFELDSEGAFDELHLHNGIAGFAPLLEPGAPARSLAALLSRLRRLHGRNLEEDTQATLAGLVRPFLETKKPS